MAIVSLAPAGSVIVHPSLSQSAHPVGMVAVTGNESRFEDEVRSAAGMQLASSDVTVSGENGEFVGEVLVNGSVDAAWNVLTDYNNFASFLPNVEESQLLSSNGNQVVFEQVNVFRISAFSRRERVTVTALEQYPNQISFTVTEGNVESLQGVWRLREVSSNQVLVTHQVSIDPGSSIFRDVYLSIYRGELANTLSALKQEVERRGG